MAPSNLTENHTAGVSVQLASKLCREEASKMFRVAKNNSLLKKTQNKREYFSLKPYFRKHQ